jgi:hypothetical protein
MQAMTNDLPKASSRSSDEQRDESNEDCSTLPIEGQRRPTEWVVCSIDPKPEVDVCLAMSFESPITCWTNENYLDIPNLLVSSIQ